MAGLLVTSNFFFSHNVFKRLVLEKCNNQGLFGKGIRYLDPDDQFFNRVISVIFVVQRETTLTI